MLLINNYHGDKNAYKLPMMKMRIVMIVMIKTCNKREAAEAALLCGGGVGEPVIVIFVIIVVIVVCYHC